VNEFFRKFATKAAEAMGSSWSFLMATAIIVVWALTGPLFHFSDTWQLVINTSTTIITFLMVFLIQKAQNKESVAVQLKLNELVAAHEFASNRLVDVENMSEEELKIIQKYYSKLKLHTQKEESLQQSHSIDEADEQHQLKKDIEKDIINRVQGKSC